MERVDNDFLLIKAGREYFEKLLLELDKAKTEVLINIYEIKLDTVGEKFLEALNKCSEKGVIINLLVDAVGSFESYQKIKKIISEEIKFTVFNEFSKNSVFRFNRRLHQKCIVIDQKTAFIGGVNISEEYLCNSESVPWLDYSVYVKGKICLEILRKISPYHKDYAKGKKLSQKSTQKQNTENILLQDFWRGKRELSRTYLKKIKNAKKSIVIMNAYFFPRRSFLRQLRKATKRGVEIEIILNYNSDSKFVDWLTKFLYADLDRVGIKIYEWKKSVLHSKIAIVDNQWCTIGSYNLDDLSRFSNIELNYSSSDIEKVKIVSSELSRIKKTCEKVNLEKKYIMAFLIRVRGAVCLLIYKVSFFLFKTAFIKKSKPS